MQTLLEILPKLKNKKIMVIGDMVADVYLEGKIARISREAPVLILEHAAEVVVPGGAANATYNVAALGGEVFAVGVVGDDYAGSQLRQELSAKGIHIEGLINEVGRPTITKTRIMAGGQATVRQQIVRIDRESKAPFSEETEEKVVQYVKDNLKNMAAVVLSDYGSHTVSSHIRENVIDYCKEAGIPCMVDSRYDVMSYKGVTVVKQNESEAAAAVGLKTINTASLRQAGKIILEHLDAEAVLISRGPDGMTLFEKNGRISDIPVTNKSEVYDVTGAGDTVVAAMTLALAAGAIYYDAARLSNFAAGIVVRKLGTATVDPVELKEAIGNHQE
ncbi:rfaE bifunctional protein, domain I [Propionispora hippei DSM 15287]|uniref:RfaE bifunctional protein, domain I n=2 Tax=Propionispora TaxID=112902 RepID=A0A1M6K4F4_9FIRM|nr:rfaE bifunctional protein, domain I [Propionispora hippei DSM 15287]